MHIQQFSAHETNPASKPQQVATLNAFGWIVRVGVVVLVALALAYLMLLNALATLGFDLENLKAENLSYKKEMEKWDIEIAIPSSLYALESLESVQSMAKIDRKTYLTIESDDVAMVKTVDSIQ